MIALIYSYLYVIIIIIIATILDNKRILSDEGSRKFIHICVGNWILLAYFLFDDLYLALIPPFTFIFLNWLSFRFNLVKAIERENKSINDLGSVYYAISLFLLILVDFLLFDEIKFAVLPILIMGYGDGLSAVIGKKFKSILILGNKTLYGTITMLMVSVILTIIMGYDLPTILIISISAAFVELVTPKGFDNLTVPILIYALLYFFVSL